MTSYGLYGLPEPERPKRPRSKWRWVIHVVLFLAVALGIVLVLLSRQGGNSDSLKHFLENYISEETGYHAEIGTLNALSFYPVLGLDMDDVTLRRRADDSLVASFGHANFSVGFWTAASGRSSIRTFVIKDAAINAGVIAPKKIDIDFFGIDVDQQDRPVLRIDGDYGDEKLHGFIDLERKTSWTGDSSFLIAEDKSMVVELGDARLDSILGVSRKGGRTITIRSLEAGTDMLPLKGHLELMHGDGVIHYNGNLRGGDSHIDYALAVAHKDQGGGVSGDITATRLDLADMLGQGGFIDIYTRLMTLYHGDAAEEGRFLARDADLSIAVENLSYNKVALGTLSFPVSVRDHVLHIGTATGILGGGAVQGEMTVNAVERPATLDAEFRVKKQGRSGLALSLESRGTDWAGLLDSLQGRMTLIMAPELRGPDTGDAADDPAILPLTPFLSAILTGGVVPPVNCGMVDMTVTGRDMDFRTLFLDAPPLSLIGKGTWENSVLDMILEPAGVSAQDTAIHVVSTADDTVIRKTPASGKDMPDDLVPHFGFVTLGLDMDHPCTPYLKVEGQEP